MPPQLLYSIPNCYNSWKTSRRDEEPAYVRGKHCFVNFRNHSFSFKSSNHHPFSFARPVHFGRLRVVQSLVLQDRAGHHPTCNSENISIELENAVDSSVSANNVI